MTLDEFMHHATRALATMKGRRKDPDARERATNEGLSEYAEERGFPGFLEEFESELQKSRRRG